MTRTMVLMTALVAMVTLIGAGCGNPASNPPPAPTPAPAEVKPTLYKYTPRAGLPPEGWTFPSGTWKLVLDATGPSRGQVLAQTAPSPSTDYNVALVSASKMKDVDITLSLKPIKGLGDQGGGPIWRAVDARNYYVARWNPLEENYRFYKVIDGKRTQLATADIKGKPTGWHTMRVTMQGDTVTCWLDGGQVFSVKDTSLAAAGMFGLWTKGDAATNFDNFTVTGK